MKLKISAVCSQGLVRARNEDSILTCEDTVSRKHCKIVREGEKFFMVNYSGSNGTEVGGVQTKEIVKRLFIRPGDGIVMGDVTFVFSVVGGAGKR